MTFVSSPLWSVISELLSPQIDEIFQDFSTEVAAEKSAQRFPTLSLIRTGLPWAAAKGLSLLKSSFSELFCSETNSA